jgi:hypothetical protein
MRDACVARGCLCDARASMCVCSRVLSRATLRVLSRARTRVSYVHDGSVMKARCVCAATMVCVGMRARMMRGPEERLRGNTCVCMYDAWATSVCAMRVRTMRIRRLLACVAPVLRVCVACARCSCEMVAVALALALAVALALVCVGHNACCLTRRDLLTCYLRAAIMLRGSCAHNACASTMRTQA